MTKSITAKCMEELRKGYKAGCIDLNVLAELWQSAHRWVGLRTATADADANMAFPAKWPTTKLQKWTRKRTRNSATYSRDAPTCFKSSMVASAARPIAIWPALNEPRNCGFTLF